MMFLSMFMAALPLEIDQAALNKVKRDSVVCYRNDTTKTAALVVQSFHRGYSFKTRHRVIKPNAKLCMRFDKVKKVEAAFYDVTTYQTLNLIDHKKMIKASYRNCDSLKGNDAKIYALQANNICATDETITKDDIRKLVINAKPIK